MGQEGKGEARMDGATGFGDRGRESDWTSSWSPDEQVDNRSWSRRLTEPPAEFAIPPTVRRSIVAAGPPGPVAPPRKRRSALFVSSVAVVIIVVAILVLAPFLSTRGCSLPASHVNVKLVMEEPRRARYQPK